MTVNYYDSNSSGGNASTQPLFGFLRLDLPLLLGLLCISGLSLVVLYSASGQDWPTLQKQIVRLSLAYFLMLVVAHIPPSTLRSWSPAIFIVCVLMLVAVLLVGVVGKGAQRWLSLGVIRFQPSEAMKLAAPMMVAWYMSQKPLPPTVWRSVIAMSIVLVPVVLIIKQPDLGTSLLVFAAGFFVLFLAGISWRLLFSVIGLVAVAAPVYWQYFMYAYQKRRVLTFLNPEADPLGAGYNIIQSKIAVGSGGVFGKGWLNGTQSSLSFLPESSTDFIFAVYGEEFGLVGGVLLLGLYFFVIARCLYMAANAQEVYGRLLAGALALTFFVYVFVNIGMVTGLLPVVGVPLPLVSYGGTSMVTLMIGFGVLMSVHSHRRLLSR